MMLVYRSQSQRVDPGLRLARLRREVSIAEHSGVVSHEQAADWLIDFGELEAGVMDALCPETDDNSSTARRLRQGALCFGQVFGNAWKERTGESGVHLAELSRVLGEVEMTPLPASVPISPPEGYAHYGLYPETYLAAADAFYDERHPQQVVCIGLRSIGTSLSAVVGAALERRGVEVKSYTVRPRGHPFDRRLQFTPRLAQEWAALADSYFLVVDEGPGMSGSSLGAAARALMELGLTAERIVFFPSWEPDGSQFVNAEARRRWSRHRKYTATFEQVWVESGKLARRWPDGEWLDVSGGQWRSLFYRRAIDFPAAHPQHERRKYLVRSGDGTNRRWAKFASLGRYGKAKLPRAEALAEAGFAPRPRGLGGGFLVSDFVAGQPLIRSDVGESLLLRMATYLAFLKSNFSANRAAPREQIREMVRLNVTEGLGPQWARRLADSKLCETEFETAACAIDGRMMPHEWLRSGDGYVKADGLDHHDDHFYPGCEDLAWDVAGCCIEFELDQSAAEYFIARYQALTADADLVKRLPFYSIAYAAFRLGYSTLAVQTLGESPEAARFQILQRRYAEALKRGISRQAAL